jgi:hypothetical protein
MGNYKPEYWCNREDDLIAVEVCGRKQQVTICGVCSTRRISLDPAKYNKCCACGNIGGEVGEEDGKPLR